MVTPRYFPHAGGIQSHVREVSSRLEAAGAHVEVLTTDNDGGLPPRENVGTIPVRRVNAWPRGRDYYLAPMIARVVAHGGWDLVHVQGVHTFVAPLAMLAARRARMPYVVTFHTGGHSTTLRHRLRSVQWRLLAPLLRGACRLVAVSRFEQDLFQRIVRPRHGQLTMIRNGSEGLRAPDGAAPSAQRRQTPHIASIGRLERYKGHHLAIEALPYLEARGERPRLTILGTGPYEAELRRLAAARGVADRCTFRSIAGDDREQMARFLAGVDLVVLLSEYEAHPVAVTEALGMGRPVLVAHTSGLAELADAGLVDSVPLDSAPAALATAMHRRLTTPARVAPVNLPTWDDTARELRELYVECLSA